MYKFITLMPVSGQWRLIAKPLHCLATVYL